LAELLLRRFDHTALKLVAVTGYASFDDQQRSKRAGFDLHLRKPMEFDKLEKILSAYPNSSLRYHWRQQQARYGAFGRL
jgi:CheY-like chemotaxis protein